MMYDFSLSRNQKILDSDCARHCFIGWCKCEFFCPLEGISIDHIYKYVQSPLIPQMCFYKTTNTVCENRFSVALLLIKL